MSESEKINRIKEILIEAEGIADNQEFGLSYGQAITYLEEIEEIIKKINDDNVNNISEMVSKIESSSNKEKIKITYLRNKETFNTILDNCCDCKRAMLEEYQDRFQDLYKTAEE